jgi:hypothetical protein
VKFVKEKNLGNFVEKLKETVVLKKFQVKATAVKQSKTRAGSTEKSNRGFFDRRRSSD